MCAIAGIFSGGGLGELAGALHRATEVAAHRGPDGRGLVFLSSRRDVAAPPLILRKRPDETAIGPYDIGLGHRRLAIIDLTDDGLQPMASADQRHWIIFNGEIYNYLELRGELQESGCVFRSRTDTEVILHAYQRWGRDCVQRFNGMWSFAIVDLERGIIFCSRDRFGIKPFHYILGGRRFAFASEIKQLLEFPFVPRRVNQRAAAEFLIYAATDYCEETFFEGVKKLLQGHNLIFDLSSEQLRVERYYDPPLAVNHDITPREAAARFRELLTDSVRLRLRSDVEVGSCLSGGLDSSSIVCLMNRELAAQDKSSIQRTFTTHFDEDEANELEYAEEIIHTTGVRSHVIRPTPQDLLDDLDRLVWHQEEPFASTSIFAQWSVYKLAHEHGVKVMLDGQAADEVLGGYASLRPTFYAELAAKRRMMLLAWERWRQLALDPAQGGGIVRRVCHALGFGATANDAVGSAVPISPLRDSVAAELEGHSRYLESQRVTCFPDEESFNNLLYRLAFVNNLQSLFRYQDRNSMAFSVEGRVPFADYRLVELVFSMPSTLKIRRGYTKRVLRDAMAGLLPDRVRWRVSKLGFATPERSWQQSALKPFITETLHDERLALYITPDRAAEAVAQLDHLPVVNGTLWRCVSLSLWQKRYDLDA